MIRLRNHILAIVVCTLMVLCLSVRSSPAAFVDVGLGARPVGLGRAFVALADDANAALYNPAGLASLDRTELTSMYARLYPGIQDDKLHMGYLGVARPISRFGTLGLAVTNLWADLYGENVFYLSYGRSLADHLSLGANLKMLRWSAEGYTDAETGQSESGLSWSGLALDMGLLYRLNRRLLGADGVQLGLALFNINQPSAADNGSEDARIPLGIEAGLVYLKDNFKLLLSYSRRDHKNRLHVGQELELWNQQYRLGTVSFSIRAGGFALFSEGDGGELDFGCGFALRNALVDYAYVYPLALRDVGGCHKISIGYGF
jgi:hypothetical protein